MSTPDAPKRRNRQARVVLRTAAGLTPTTLQRLNRSTGPARWISRRQTELQRALGADITPIMAQATWITAFFEFKVGLMMAASLQHGDGANGEHLDRTIRAARALHSWYEYLGAPLPDRRPPSLEAWLAQNAQVAVEAEGTTDDTTPVEIASPGAAQEVEQP